MRFDTPVAQNVRHGAAPLYDLGRNKERAMAVGRVRFTAHERRAFVPSPLEQMIEVQRERRCGRHRLVRENAWSG